MKPEILTSKGKEALAAEDLNPYLLDGIEHRWNTSFYTLHGAPGLAHTDVGALLREVRRLQAEPMNMEIDFTALDALNDDLCREIDSLKYELGRFKEVSKGVFIKRDST